MRQGTAMLRPLGLPDHLARHYRVLIATAALVIVAAGIREAAEVLNSILLAMLLTVTVVPAFDALRRGACPRVWRLSLPPCCWRAC